MKKKPQLIFVLVLVILITSFLTYKKVNSEITSNEISLLREQHATHLANSPFKKTLKLSKKERKSKGIPPNKYFERQWELTMDPSTGKTHPERLFSLQESLLSLKQISNRNPGSETWNNWEERGPNNVGGRTRAIMFDPNDLTNKRVFAGGVSGGLWVNDNIADENSSWEIVDIPQNLAISCITYDPNNTNIFYIGTGESYVAGDVNGNGLWQSIDGGINWLKIFGGVTGETTFKTNVKLTVNSPSLIAGDYQATSASFGPKITTITGNLVLTNDSSELPTEACNILTNNSAINGNIAVIERGNCFFVEKVKNAQDAGAIAVLIINNVIGPPIGMGGEDLTITIPTAMISKEEGAFIIQQLDNGVNVTIEATDSPFSGSFVTPGIQHINDIKVRDIGGGNSEIYVAVGESYYSNSSPSSLLSVEQYGLYKSDNEGLSWSEVLLPLTIEGDKYAPNDIEIGPDNTIWVSTTNSILYGNGGGTVLSSTNGSTFTVKHSIVDGDRTQIAVSKLNTGVVYVLAELNNEENPLYLAKTQDAFNVVEIVAKPNDADINIPNNDFTRGQAFYDLMLEVDPMNDEILYVGGVDLFRSQDGGSNWNQISKWTNNNNLAGLSVSLVHADQHILVFNPSDSNQGVFGTDGGIYYGSSLSDASTSTTAISSRNNNYNTLQFYKGAIGSDSSVEKLIAGAQDNGSQLINNATSGINSSIEVTDGDGAYVFIDKDKEYIVTSYVYNAYYLLNYNTGDFIYTIANNDSDGDFINPAALDSDHNILYASGENKIYKYTLNSNSATTTTLINDLLTSNPTALKTSRFTTSTLFVGTESGKLLKLLNANLTTPTWIDITGDNFYGSISCIELGETEDQIMVTFHNYGIKNVYYSEDGGVSWQNKEGNLPDLPVKSILMSPIDSNEVILGTDLGVWGTSNFNDLNPTWYQSQNGMKDVQVTSFDLRKSDNTVLASTYGRGLFTAKFTIDNYNNDDDNDTVIDGLDLCPNTPVGEIVNSDGCSESQLDDDGDGVMNDVDQCLDTPTGKPIDATGCEIFNLPSNNFEIIVSSETCLGKKNGKISISAIEDYTYTTSINGEDYTFDTINDVLAIGLPPDIYTFCIGVDLVGEEEFKQCFEVEVFPGTSVSGKSIVKSNKAFIEIEEGTAPFIIYVNGEETFKTNASIFNVNVKYGDVVEVKTAVSCEGVYSKTIDLLDVIVAYPNPTKSNVEIALPISKQEVIIELYNSSSQLISKKTYPVVYRKVQLDLTNNSTGIYFAKVYIDNKPVTIKILKQ